MSEQDVIKFLKKTEEDPGLKDEVAAALEGVEEKASAAVAIAARLGYDFTAEELTEVTQGLRLEEGKLSDEELDAVAGGGGMVLLGG